MTHENEANLVRLNARVADWREKARAHAELCEKYRTQWSTLASGAAGAESARKNVADSQTGELRLARDLAEIDMQAAYHLMIAVRGTAGEAART